METEEKQHFCFKLSLIYLIYELQVTSNNSGCYYLNPFSDHLYTLKKILDGSNVAVQSHTSLQMFLIVCLLYSWVRYSILSHCQLVTWISYIQPLLLSPILCTGITVIIQIYIMILKKFLTEQLNELESKQN